MSSIGDIIKKRRTQKMMNCKEVSESEIQKLLDLSVWAPNHRLNHPWRFKVLTQTGVAKLLSSLNAQLTPEEKEAFKGPMERVAKAGAVIFVSSLKDEKPVLDYENYAAVCCAIQNILLAATEQGIQSYWSTGKFFQHSLISKYLQIQEIDRFVGAIWLGYGESPDAPARRPASEMTAWFR